MNPPDQEPTTKKAKRSPSPLETKLDELNNTLARLWNIWEDYTSKDFMEDMRRMRNRINLLDAKTVGGYVQDDLQCHLVTIAVWKENLKNQDHLVDTLAGRTRKGIISYLEQVQTCLNG